MQNMYKSGWEKIKKFLLSLKQGNEYKEMNFAFLWLDVLFYFLMQMKS